MVFGYDLLCDLLEMFEFNKYRERCCNYVYFFFDVFFSIIPFLLLHLIYFIFQNRLVQCLALVMYLVPRVHNSRRVYIPQMNPCRAPRDPWRRQACFNLQVVPFERSTAQHLYARLSIIQNPLKVSNHVNFTVARFVTLLIALIQPQNKRDWFLNVNIYNNVY
jgi:hypothetical protein